MTDLGQADRTLRRSSGPIDRQRAIAQLEKKNVALIAALEDVLATCTPYSPRGTAAVAAAREALKLAKGQA